MTEKPNCKALEKRIRQLERSEAERKKTEKELKESQAKLKEAQKLAGLGYWSWDIETGEVVWSDEVYEIFGQDPTCFQTTIDTILKLSPWPEEQQRGQELIQKAVINREKGEYDQKFLYPDGSIGYYHSTFQGNYDEKGKLLSITGTVLDVTGRKQAEEALLESEKRYRSLVEHTQDGYFIFDHSVDRLLFLNQRFCDIFRYPMEEALTRSLWEFIVPEEREQIKKQIQDGTNREEENFLITLDGMCKDRQVIRVELSVTVVGYEGKNVTQGVLRDITEKERLQRQVEQSQKMESVGRLAGGIAHDFNNMLNVIIGRTELLLLEPDIKEFFHANLEEIHTAAKKSSGLTRQLLGFARQQVISPETLDLNKNIRLTLLLLNRIIGEEITLLPDLAEDLWPVKLDPSQLDQIVINLCLNARDAISGAGTITIETANTEIDDEYCRSHLHFRPGSWVQLAVSDDGCGIDDENRRYIFEPFFSTKETGKGTGLGLATVYGIVKQNDGFINVYSEPGLGTTFKVYLPRTLDKTRKKTVSEGSSCHKGEETVLLVEDESSILDLGKVVLQRFGYNVLTALHPKDAIKIAREFEDTIHLLITDVVLPQMNGKQLRDRITKIKPNIKSLFISGYTSNVITHRGVLEEDVHFLAKPFSIHTLSKKVREVLDH